MTNAEIESMINEHVTWWQMRLVSPREAGLSMGKPDCSSWWMVAGFMRWHLRNGRRHAPQNHVWQNLQ